MTTSSGPLAEFLRDRRESLTPAQVGLSDSSRRRVRGLRRTEVAELAGISADYYLRIEQGRGHRPSAEVLSALSRALLLDVYGDEHLHRVANLSAGHEAPAVSDEVPAGIRELLDLHPETPAYLSNGTLDVIGVNEAGRLLAPGGLRPGLNLVLSVFEHYPDPHSESHWRRAASNLVASLRYHADPRSPRLRHIVDTLSATDPRFVELWQRCEVRPHTSSWPLVYIESHGWVGLRSETLAIPASRGCTMTQFFAEPNTPGVEALRDLVRRAYGREPRVEPSA